MELKSLNISHIYLIVELQNLFMLDKITLGHITELKELKSH